MFSRLASYLMGGAAEAEIEGEIVPAPLGTPSLVDEQTTAQVPEEAAAAPAAALAREQPKLRQTEVEGEDWILIDRCVEGCTGMEESWYVTPPACFTRPGPVHVEVSPLENLLIEHPSMSVYAGAPLDNSSISSDATLVDVDEDTPDDDDDDDDDDLINQAVLVPPVVAVAAVPPKPTRTGPSSQALLPSSTTTTNSSNTKTKTKSKASTSSKHSLWVGVEQRQPAADWRQKRQPAAKLRRTFQEEAMQISEEPAQEPKKSHDQEKEQTLRIVYEAYCAPKSRQPAVPAKLPAAGGCASGNCLCCQTGRNSLGYLQELRRKNMAKQAKENRQPSRQQQRRQQQQQQQLQQQQQQQQQASANAADQVQRPRQTNNHMRDIRNTAAEESARVAQIRSAQQVLQKRSTQTAKRNRLDRANKVREVANGKSRRPRRQDRLRLNNSGANNNRKC